MRLFWVGRCLGGDWGFKRLCLKVKTPLILLESAAIGRCHRLLTPYWPIEGSPTGGHWLARPTTRADLTSKGELLGRQRQESQKPSPGVLLRGTELKTDRIGQGRRLLDSVQDSKALWSMIFARIIYALNWMNVGAIFFLMGPELNAGVSGLGTISAAFYLGIGTMQVPGGILVAKWGPKKVSVIGVFLSSLSALGTSAMTSIPEVAILRFVVGAGMAFVFAPGVVIVARLLLGGKSGIGVGLYNSAYDVGGALALFGWVIVAEATGWRLSLAISGSLGVLSGLLTLLFVPRDQTNLVSSIGRGPLMTILRDRQLIMVGLGMLGFDMSNSIVSGFMIYYLLSINAATATVAGLVASLVTIVPIFTSLWAGRVYDSIMKHRLVMAIGIVGSALSLAFGAYPSLYAAVACTVLSGVVCGVGYTFGFAGARDLHRAGKEYEGLAIAWVNSIHLTGSVLPPILFSLVVERLGYSQGWLWSAVVTLLFIVPVLLMVEHWRR